MVISGQVEEIRFRNDENGYTIIVIDCDGEPVVAVGEFPPVGEGETVRLSGQFVVHPRFGRQFKADGLSKSAPASTTAITRYLASGIIKGVGEKTAVAIVDKFGADSLKVIEFSPQTLALVKGISKNKAAEISKFYKDGREMQEAVMFLQNQNIGLRLAIKVYKNYGESTIAVISSNPYRLIEDIDGVGFITADKIAAEMGIEKDSDFRIRAIVLYVLKESSEKYGNTYLPRNVLIDEVFAYGITDKEKIDGIISLLAMDRRVKCYNLCGEDIVMIKKLFSAEMNIASKLLKLENNEDNSNYDCSSDIDEFERVNKLEMHENQRFAISCAINNGVSIITGGPGTGKTTILKCLLTIADKFNLRPMLMAPTGRAAKRLTESTGFEASTIHRALMLNPDAENNTSHQRINADIIIIDEFSMVDVFLFNSLIYRMVSGMKLVIVGDKDQLPSVGAGNCLKDLLLCSAFPSVNLTKIYRQSEKSLISLNAHAINNGIMPELGSNSSDFFFLKCKDQPTMASKIVELYSERIPKYLNIEPNKVQILCPLKNGITGAHSLNRSLQQILNPNNFGGISGKDVNDVFLAGDKVMHISNDYNMEWVRRKAYSEEKGTGVFNGDLGNVVAVYPERGSMDVEFEDGRLVSYTPDTIEQLTLAYAITVHKSQGSEFDAIIMPVTGGSPVMMTRNLLYTAITRAKKMVVLVGEEYHIRKMVENNYIAQRYSALSFFVSEIKKDLSILFDMD